MLGLCQDSPTTDMDALKVYDEFAPQILWTDRPARDALERCAERCGRLVPPRCAHCAAPAEKRRCGRCTTLYCSKRCQEIHWHRGGHLGGNQTARCRQGAISLCAA